LIARFAKFNAPTAGSKFVARCAFTAVAFSISNLRLAVKPP
jgi:hypothetical protein